MDPGAEVSYDFPMGVEPNHRLARALACDLPPGRKAAQGSHTVALHTDSRLSNKWLCPAEVSKCRRGFYLSIRVIAVLKAQRCLPVSTYMRIVAAKKQAANSQLYIGGKAIILEPAPPGARWGARA